MSGSDSYIVENAVITSASIDTAEGRTLDVSLGLDYGGYHQRFGGFVLYLPPSYRNHKLESPAGHFLWRVMEIAGVDQWSDLTGKTIRSRHNFCEVDAIGHIIKNDWFCPREDFRCLRDE